MKNLFVKDPSLMLRMTLPETKGTVPAVFKNILKSLNVYPVEKPIEPRRKTEGTVPLVCPRIAVGASFFAVI